MFRQKIPAVDNPAGIAALTKQQPHGWSHRHAFIACKSHNPEIISKYFSRSKLRYTNMIRAIVFIVTPQRSKDHLPTLCIYTIS